VTGAGGQLRRFALAPIALVAWAGVSACGGDDLTLPSQAAPAALAIVSGDGQRGSPGEWLSDPIVVEVRDAVDRPVEGAAVAFAFSGGGGAVDPGTAVTDSSGRVSATVRLGGSAGEQTVVVSASSQSARELTAAFHLTAVQPAPPPEGGGDGDGGTSPSGGGGSNDGGGKGKGKGKGKGGG
jgi:hypothetical protein